MHIWIVKDGYDDIVDYFATAEGVYSYMEAEVNRWNDEYPLDIPDSVAYLFKKKLYNAFKNNNSYFEVGEREIMDWYLKAIRVEVKE